MQGDEDSPDGNAEGNFRKRVAMLTPHEDARAHDLLRPECASRYDAQLTRIWWTLIRLRESMHIVNSIVKYPLERFVEPHHLVFFWQLLVRNCGDAVVLGIHSLLNDDGSDTLTLRKLANRTRDWLKPDYEEWYRERLRSAKFNGTLNDIEVRVTAKRHAVAHIFLQPSGMPAERTPGVSDPEIEELYKATRALFRIACLTEEFVIDQEDYRAGGPGPRPIDKLLELVAKNSNWITEPEQMGEMWGTLRKYKAQEDLKELNEWRKRLQLPPC